MTQTSKKTLTIDVSINSLLDGNPVELDFIRQAVKEKIERDAAKDINTIPEPKRGGNINDGFYVEGDSGKEFIVTV